VLSRRVRCWLLANTAASSFRAIDFNGDGRLSNDELYVAVLLVYLKVARFVRL
jgi:hypothetical protein